VTQAPQYMRSTRHRTYSGAAAANAKASGPAWK
jgi:hypothetical protein